VIPPFRFDRAATDVPGRLRAGLTAARTDLPVRSRPPGPDDRHLAAAVDWLRRSQDATDGGGSAATYNLVLGWADAYPETTGYVVPTLLSYADATDDPEAADRAIRMADWLCTVQRADGSFPGGTGESGEPNVFNTGQIVFGLTAAAREADGTDGQYRDAVREACDWLVDRQADDGRWAANDYRGVAHAYSTRIAWALAEAGRLLPDRAAAYRGAARRNLEWVVGLQRRNGWIERAGFDPGATPYLHTIAYTVRGLLEAGLAVDDAAAVDAATRTADELLAIQRADGILKGAYDASWSPAWYYCLTGNAQTAVVWLRLAAETGEDDYRAAARRTIGFLKRRQPMAGSPRVRGGLAGSYPVFGRYIYLRFPNWAAKFLADALLLARDGPPTGIGWGSESGSDPGLRPG